MNGKIVIRSAKQKDAEGILEIYTPYILHTPVSFETEVPDIEAFRQRMVQYQKNLPWLVCEVDNNLVGIYHDVGYKSGRYHDVGWWELPIGTNTKPHVPWAEFDNTIKWQKAILNGISRIK